MTEEVMNQTPLCLHRRVGNTNYKVNIRFSEQATRTMEDAILRLVENEALHIDSSYDIMGLPQMSRQSERSVSCA